jgi:hypothetical protein
LSGRSLHKNIGGFGCFLARRRRRLYNAERRERLGMSTKTDWPEVEPKQIQVRRAAERGHANHDWLDTLL